MAIFRVEKSANYTVMSNYHLRDNALTLKAKGLLSQMLSLPEEWDYTLSGLAAINKEGKDAIRSAVQELEQAGYIQRMQTHDENGNFSGNEYIIHEQPIFDEPKYDYVVTGGTSKAEPLDDWLDSPLLGFPTTENPSSENPTEINKDISSKDINKKKNKKEKADGSKKRTPLADEQLRALFIAWIGQTAADYWTKKDKNTLYFALDGFYAPRANKKQEPARTAAAFTALSNRLIRYSDGSPTVMIDMLERATTAGWKSVFPLNGDNGRREQKPAGSGRAEEWL